MDHSKIKTIVTYPNGEQRTRYFYPDKLQLGAVFNDRTEGLKPSDWFRVKLQKNTWSHYSIEEISGDRSECTVAVAEETPTITWYTENGCVGGFCD